MSVFTYSAFDIVITEDNGFKSWKFGERIQWHVLVRDGEILGRRRSRAELAELMPR